MIYKKILILFIIFFTLFGLTSVFGAEIPATNVSTDLTYYVKRDLDFFRYALYQNDIYNINDYKKLIKDAGLKPTNYSRYFVVYPVGYEYGTETNPIAQGSNYFYNVYFFSTALFPQDDSGSGLWYNVTTNYKTMPCTGVLTIRITNQALVLNASIVPSSVVVPSCWQWHYIDEFFEYDAVTSSIDDIHRDLTVDTSKQSDINLNKHDGEMNEASNQIKNSNLYNKFSNLSNEIQDNFSYDDDEVSTLPISFNNKNYVLRSNEISSFFKNNNLGFVVLLWQSVLWFSLFYTMFIFIRKLYKAVTGGNSVDDVQKSLSNEDDKIVGGF